MEAPAVLPEGPPKYWQYEPNSLLLGRAVMRYLNAEPLTIEDIALIAVYLRHWIEAPCWDRLMRSSRMKAWTRRFPLGLSELRVSVLRIHSRHDIEEWRSSAAAIGIDPF